ncbi:MAG: hypothetical protein WEA75_07550 [Acidimicrobiia bacterium]
MTDLRDDLRTYVEHLASRAEEAAVDPRDHAPRSLKTREHRPSWVFAVIVTVAVGVAAAGWLIVDRTDERHKISTPPTTTSRVSITEELHLLPSYVPAGFELQRAHGWSDLYREDGRAGTPGVDQEQTWVRFDRSGTRPIATFTLSWGIGYRGDGDEDIDPLAPYINSGGTKVKVRGKTGYYVTLTNAPVGSPPTTMLAWQETEDQVVTLVSHASTPWGTFETHLSRDQLFKIAKRLRRSSDESFSLATPPRGFELVADQPGMASHGENQRILLYSDGNDHGFKVELIDNTEVPPGTNFAIPTARRITVQGQEAVLTPQSANPPGGSCWLGDGDFFLCNNDNAIYLVWMATPNTRVAIVAVGLTETDIIKIAQNMQAIDQTEWEELNAAHPSAFPDATAP